MPADSVEALASTTAKLKVLLDRYAAPGSGDAGAPLVPDRAACLAEWDTLFHIIDRKYRAHDFSTVWAYILTKTADAEFKHIKALACVRLVMQLTSAVNERGFSRLKNIKSDLRTCLGDDLLDWLMLITIEGPELKDRDAVRALCLRAMRSWLQLKKRVPSRGNPGATRERKKAASADGETLLDMLASKNETPLGSAASAARQAQKSSPKPNFVIAAGALPDDLKGLTVYHVFDEIGWCRGKVRGGRVKTGNTAGYYQVAYAAGVYGGQNWQQSVMAHELKREDYDRLWVVVQATDKACARCAPHGHVILNT